MIKRIQFATRSKDLPESAFPAAWRQVVTAAADVPPEARPSRIAVCTTLADLTGPNPKHDGIGVEWFADPAHLERFTRWLETPGGLALRDLLDRIVDRDASPAVVADESVLRGPDWLERRWRDGGEKLKHMAIALRAAELTPAEFAQRWRSRPGQIRRPGSAQATVMIPDEARGLAYVQNHPRPRTAGEWADDAVNEVYFDDAWRLRTRRERLRESRAALPARDCAFVDSVLEGTGAEAIFQASI